MRDVTDAGRTHLGVGALQCKEARVHILDGVNEMLRLARLLSHGARVESDVRAIDVLRLRRARKTSARGRAGNMW